jgi:hypothetical protein
MEWDLFSHLIYVVLQEIFIFNFLKKLSLLCCLNVLYIFIIGVSESLGTSRHFTLNTLRTNDANLCHLRFLHYNCERQMTQICLLTHAWFLRT